MLVWRYSSSEPLLSFSPPLPISHWSHDFCIPIPEINLQPHCPRKPKIWRREPAVSKKINTHLVQSQHSKWVRGREKTVVLFLGIERETSELKVKWLYKIPDCSRKCAGTRGHFLRSKPPLCGLSWKLTVAVLNAQVAAVVWTKGRIIFISSQPGKTGSLMLALMHSALASCDGTFGFLPSKCRILCAK